MSTHTQRLAARSFMPHPANLDEPPSHARARAGEVLSHLLVEVLDVALCARHAHWNARGLDFLMVYGLLEEVGSRLDGQADRIARRIRALGGAALGTAQAIATGSSFKPYPVAVAPSQDHLEALALRLGLLSAEARLSIHEMRHGIDPVTAKVLTEAAASIDDALWLVENHLVQRHEVREGPGESSRRT